jgi:hypothetical protein
VDRRGDGAVALEVLAGLLAAFDLGSVDLVAGGVVAHRLERDVRAPQQTGGHLGRDALVPGQFLDDPDLVLGCDLRDDRGTAQDVRGDGRGDVVLAGQLRRRPHLGLGRDLGDHVWAPQ